MSNPPTPTPPHDDPDVYLSEAEAARMLAFSVRTLQAGRGALQGLRYFRLSARCIRYKRADLDDFMAVRAQVVAG